jgi:hypothetical protein
VAGETELLGENLPLSPLQIPHDLIRGLNPERSSGKPATNSLSYGTALPQSYLRNLINLTVSVKHFGIFLPYICIGNLENLHRIPERLFKGS